MKLRRGIVFVLLLAACAGVTARQKVLFPVAAKVYKHIQPLIERGVQAGLTSGALTEDAAAAIRAEAKALESALDARDVDALKNVDYAVVLKNAAVGLKDAVESGDFSQAVAESVAKQLQNLLDALNKLIER